MTYLAAVLRFCALAFLLSRLSAAADADRDPGGWNEVQFGMTRQQVIDVLRGKVTVEPDRSVQRPLMSPTNAVAVIPEAIAEANEIIEQAAQPGAKRDAKVELAEQLLKHLKPAKWGVSATVFDSSKRSSRSAARMRKTIDGTLEGIVDLAAHGRDLLIRPKGKNQDLVRVNPETLDEKSTERLRQIDDAIDELSRLLERERTVRKGRFRIDTVQVRGIILKPDVRFDNDEVGSIMLSTPGADNPTTPHNPNRHAIARTLCDALEEKFGPPDERNQVGDVEKVIWRFPKTVITCASHRLGIEISYEPPSPSNDAGSDNL
jgi:hypothetical protein